MKRFNLIFGLSALLTFIFTFQVSGQVVDDVYLTPKNSKTAMKNEKSVIENQSTSVTKNGAKQIVFVDQNGKETNVDADTIFIINDHYADGSAVADSKDTNYVADEDSLEYANRIKRFHGDGAYYYDADGNDDEIEVNYYDNYYGSPFYSWNWNSYWGGGYWNPYMSWYGGWGSYYNPWYYSSFYDPYYYGWGYYPYYDYGFGLGYYNYYWGYNYPYYGGGFYSNNTVNQSGRQNYSLGRKSMFGATGTSTMASNTRQSASRGNVSRGSNNYTVVSSARTTRNSPTSTNRSFIRTTSEGTRAVRSVSAWDNMRTSRTYNTRTTSNTSTSYSGTSGSNGVTNRSSSTYNRGVPTVNSSPARSSSYDNSSYSTRSYTNSSSSRSSYSSPASSNSSRSSSSGRSSGGSSTRSSGSSGRSR